MKSKEIANSVVKKLKTGKFDFCVINFAAPDMVGHTGKLPAAIKAVETVDSCMKKIVDLVIKMDGVAIITADHGNCEEMVGKYRTSHTINRVPLILVSEDSRKLKLRKGLLGDIAPTFLKLMGIPKPKEMTGKSLVAN